MMLSAVSEVVADAPNSVLKCPTQEVLATVSSRRAAWSDWDRDDVSTDR